MHLPIIVCTGINCRHDCVLVNILVSSADDCWFHHWSSQTKDYETSTMYFSEEIKTPFPWYTVMLICYYFWRLYLYLGIQNTVQLYRFYHYLRRCHMDTLSTYNITRHWEMFWTWWSQILLWDNYKYIHVVIKTFTAHDAFLE